jgi:7-keto-8-aminopelargonate synthetase-like enzyme
VEPHLAAGSSIGTFTRVSGCGVGTCSTTRPTSARLARHHGFAVVPGEHPIIPVLLGDAAVAGQLADRLLANGVFVTAFSYPVVPRGSARIRTQMSAAHSRADLDEAIRAFAEARAELGLAMIPAG